MNHPRTPSDALIGPATTPRGSLEGVKRLIRTVLIVGAVAAALWLARAALKSFVDGPEVTPASGGWPDRAGGSAERRPSTTTDAAGGTRTTDAAGTAGATHANDSYGDGKAPAPTKTRKVGTSRSAAAPKAASAKPAGTPRKTEAGAKKASRPSKRPAPANTSDGSAAWVVPNGTAEVLQTHPVKAKLSSRVYRTPGMPMYDRTVADRCYPTVEAAEADGFTRAAR